MLPIAIVAFSGTARYAPFAMAFTIVTAFDMVIFDAAAALTVEGAFAESRLRRLAITIVRTSQDHYSRGRPCYCSRGR